MRRDLIYIPLNTTGRDIEDPKMTQDIIKQLQETNRLLMLIAESLQRMEKPPVYIIPSEAYYQAVTGNQQK